MVNNTACDQMYMSLEDTLFHLGKATHEKIVISAIDKTSG